MRCSTCGWIASARGRRCSARVTSNFCAPTDTVPAPLRAFPSAVSSAVSETAPSFESSAASIDIVAPLTVTRLSAASLLAFSPLVEPA